MRSRALFGGWSSTSHSESAAAARMKQCVDRHDVATSTVHWAPAFLDFAEQPLASPPYWPRVKGKVERGVGYVKRSFLEGRTFSDLDDLKRNSPTGWPRSQSAGARDDEGRAGGPLR